MPICDKCGQYTNHRNRDGECTRCQFTHGKIWVLENMDKPLNEWRWRLDERPE